MNTSFYRFLRPALAGLLVVATLSVVPARVRAADTARLVGLEVELKEQKVLASFELEGAFDEKLKERIASGLATGIVYDFELVRLRKAWFNKDVHVGSLQVIVMYNAVSHEYLVNYKHDGDLIESRLIHDPAELEAALTRIERLEIFSLEGLADEPLRVRVRAELGTSSILFFIPTIRATEWIESERFTLVKEGVE
jgi:hypothetical protein